MNVKVGDFDHVIGWGHLPIEAHILTENAQFFSG